MLLKYSANGAETETVDAAVLYAPEKMRCEDGSASR